MRLISILRLLVAANVERPFNSSVGRLWSFFIVYSGIFLGDLASIERAFGEVYRSMNHIIYEPIGVIRSPFEEVEGTPTQPSGAQGLAGTVELEPEFSSGLRDPEDFSHIVPVYRFHLSRVYTLEVIPFLDDSHRVIFASCAHKYPTSGGISIVRLTGIEGSKLQIQDVDIEVAKGRFEPARFPT